MSADKRRMQMVVMPQMPTKILKNSHSEYPTQKLPEIRMLKQRNNLMQVDMPSGAATTTNKRSINRTNSMRKQMTQPTIPASATMKRQPTQRHFFRS